MNERRHNTPENTLGLNRHERKLFAGKLAWLREATMPTVMEISQAMNTMPERRLRAITSDQSDTIESLKLVSPLSFQYAENVIEYIRRAEGHGNLELKGLFLSKLQDLERRFPRGSIVIVTKPDETPTPAMIIDYYVRSGEDMKNLEEYFGPKRKVKSFAPFELLLLFHGMTPYKRVSVFYISELPPDETGPGE